jgi:hypothetical protein
MIGLHARAVNNPISRFQVQRSEHLRLREEEERSTRTPSPVDVVDEVVVAGPETTTVY